MDAPIPIPAFAPVLRDADGMFAGLTVLELVTSLFSEVLDGDGDIDVDAAVLSVVRDAADADDVVAALLSLAALTTNSPLKSFPAGSTPPSQSHTSTW